MQFNYRQINRLAKQTGWTVEQYEKIYNVTSVKEQDIHMWYTIQKAQTAVKDGWDIAYPEIPMTKYSWSFSFAATASNSEYTRQLVDTIIHNYTQVKPYHFFYHSRNDTFWNNSTQFRHAPMRSDVLQQLRQPSSVGYDIPADQWQYDFVHSKFCITIRGDNPQSRALWRSIRAGCIPIIISDMWKYFAPVYRSFLSFEDYTIVIDEQEFLKDPAGSLNSAINLTNIQLQDKVQALALAQQMILIDHPQSLFVQAFIRETIASQQKEYYNFTGPMFEPVKTKT